jgi:hypothetical protein
MPTANEMSIALEVSNARFMDSPLRFRQWAEEFVPPNGGIQVAARAAFKLDVIFELERRAIAAHLQ